MKQPTESRVDAVSGHDAGRLIVQWADEMNEQGLPMRWLGSWLVTRDGAEGEWFHSGLGSGTTAHPIPGGATGVRIRKWVSEGLDPEYVDLPIEGSTNIRTKELDFDAPQQDRLLQSAQH